MRFLLLVAVLLGAGPSFGYDFGQNRPRFDAESLPIILAQRDISTDTGVTNERAPDRVTWFQYQTPIRNQGDRNTCSIFAMIAAVEARYRRQFGVALDLSEQYAWHLYKSSGVTHPKYYKYENQSSYWGGGGSHGIKELKNFSIPLESFAPYKTQSQMNAIRLSIPAAGALIWTQEASTNPTTQDNVDAFEYSPLYIPTAARFNAKYGVASYTLLNQAFVRDSAQMEGRIAAGNEVMVDLQLKWKFNSATGVHEYDAAVDGGAHVFLVVGYDRPGRFYWVKNSWGESGFLKVSYDVFKNAAYSGAVASSVTAPDSPSLKSKFIGVWNMNHDGWKGKLIVRRTTNEANAPTRFGHYHTSDGKRLAVNGVSIDNGHGIRYTISNVEYDTPGTMSGQTYYAHQYSWDPNYAAGHTVWSGNQYGVWLTRGADTSAYGNDFKKEKWLGTWAMNHDGWQGTLEIQRFEDAGAHWRIVGLYKDSGGVVKTMTGDLTKGKEHLASINILLSPSNNQAFTLHHHTWSTGLFSGYTFWAGARFGAHGRK